MPDPTEPLEPLALPEPAPPSLAPHLWWILPLLILVVGLITVFVNRSDSASTKIFTQYTGSRNSSADTATLVSDDDPWLGSESANVVVVEFADFQCPYCKEAFTTIRSLMAEYGDRVLFQIRDFPVQDAHPLAVEAAIAAQCAWEQGSNIYWAFHDKLFQNQDRLTSSVIRDLAVAAGADATKLAACTPEPRIRQEVDADFQDGLALGVRGTPTFFVNDRQVEGAIDVDLFRRVLDAALADQP